MGYAQARRRGAVIDAYSPACAIFAADRFPDSCRDKRLPVVFLALPVALPPAVEIAKRQ